MYIPLGGSKKGNWKTIRNIFIIFLVSGFWHGANWTFLFWGLFHAILFLLSFIFNTNRKYTSSIIGENTLLPSPKEFFQVGLTFILVTIGWVFFRSETIFDSFDFLKQMVFQLDFPDRIRSGLLYIIPIVIVDYYLKKDERFLKTSNIKILDYVIIQLFLLVIFWFLTKPNKLDFIYFQF